LKRCGRKRNGVEMKGGEMKKAKCKHRADKPKNILQWFADAEKRQMRGDRQRQCPCCLLWIWESQYYGKAGK